MYKSGEEHVTEKWAKGVDILADVGKCDGTLKCET